MVNEFKIQIINKEYPKIIEIFEGVSNEQIDEFIRRSQGRESIKILGIRWKK